MRESSSEFAVLITPDPLMRQCVLASGSILALVGAWLLATAGLPPGLRIGIVLLWLIDSGRRLYAHRQGFRAVAAIRLSSDGAVEVISPGGRSLPARLVTGTVIHRHVAWIRLERTRRCHGELLRRSWIGLADWHRLCLIRAQSLQGFGHHGPA